MWELPVLGRGQRIFDPPYNSPVPLGVSTSAGLGSSLSISIHVPPLLRQPVAVRFWNELIVVIVSIFPAVE